MSAKVICSQGALLLGSLLFFLPFTVISCQGTKVAELTGMQLALGTHINMPDGIGVPSLQAIPPQSSLTLALALGFIALFAGFGHRSVGGRIVTIVSAFGSVAALLISKFGGSYEPLAIAALKAHMQPAYWGATLSYLAGGLINLVTLITSRNAPTPAPRPRMPGPSSKGAGPSSRGAGQSSRAAGPSSKAPSSKPPGPSSKPPGPTSRSHKPLVCPECGALWVPRQSVCRQCGASFRVVKM
jgi:hypothetical protein